MLEIVAAPSKEAAREKACRQLQQLLVDNSEPLLFLSSGGSALHLLDVLESLKDAHHITFSVLDDRYTTDPQGSNLQQFLSHPGVQQAIAQGACTLPLSVDLTRSIELNARTWSEAITQWKADHPTGRVVATIGIGADNHTYGVLPFPDESSFRQTFHTDDWYVGYHARIDTPYPDRITPNPLAHPFIDVGIIYAVGIEKRNAIMAVIEGTGSVWNTPALLLRNLPSATLYTDQ